MTTYGILITSRYHRKYLHHLRKSTIANVVVGAVTLIYRPGAATKSSPTSYFGYTFPRPRKALFSSILSATYQEYFLFNLYTTFPKKPLKNFANQSPGEVVEGDWGMVCQFQFLGCFNLQ